MSTSIPRDSPVLRVLFHAGSEATGRRQSLLGRQQRVCVLLHATPSIRGDQGGADNLTPGPLTAACSPDGQDGVCLAQITVPASWWPPLPPPDTAGRVKPVKVSFQCLRKDWDLWKLEKIYFCIFLKLKRKEKHIIQQQLKTVIFYLFVCLFREFISYIYFLGLFRKNKIKSAALSTVSAVQFLFFFPCNVKQLTPILLLQSVNKLECD